MGHLVGKDIFQSLGKKIDGLTARSPNNDKLFEILKELYSPEEAEVVAKMPYGLSTRERISAITGKPDHELAALLEGLCSKGLVIDLCVDDVYHYQPSPMVIGIFEFTMMRTRGEPDSKKWAGMFDRYMSDIFRGNNQEGAQVGLMRSLPWAETILPDDYIEVLDWEKAAHVVDSAEKCAVALCSCRHEKHHLDKKKCEVPLESCLSFDYAADYLVRNGLGREVSKEEILDQLQMSKEHGLVLNADNNKRCVTFICQCCGCCCNALAAVGRYGCTGAVVTSNFIAGIDQRTCDGCAKCKKACPIDAISLTKLGSPRGKKRFQPEIDKSVCLGCGVCGLKCKTGALKLTERPQRVLHPETTFHRVILQCLERGTLQNQLFDDPTSRSQDFMRGFVGGFLKLKPVKRALVSDLLRSRFLAFMEKGVASQGGEWITTM